ncbi:MAG: ABC transporter substrate-binding protein [Anaerolineae bacterium]|nr:ABC transporter substrate-binding protein [Anaerolineae bacterium]
MKPIRELTRREFMQASALTAAGVVLAACGQPTAEPTEAPKATEEVKTEPEPTKVEEEKPAATNKYKEAPILAALVESGDLPPVDERLPMNPCVCDVAESIGNYGGTIRRGFKGVSDRWGPTKFVDRTLTWFTKDLVQIPHLLESWEVSDDSTTWTLHLRKGVKFSDGEPLTSEAFKWFFENVIKNTTLTTSTQYSHQQIDASGNKVTCEMEFPDDYTVVLKFPMPNPLLFYTGGGTRSINGWLAPGHYMKQWHMDLVDDKAALEAKVTEAGFNSWDEYFNNDRNRFDLNPDRPQITAWLLKGSLAEEMFLMERNPYYYCVDAEGNQLPYIDSVTHRLFESTEVFNMWIVNGELDFHNRHVSLANYTLFKENEENGDYKVLLGISAGHVAMQLNLATKEPKLNEFFNTRDVRIAISLAMNRDEINELVYNGLLTPRQYSPLSMSPNYYEKLSNAYIEYNPDKANEMLDAAGYDKRDADGFRMFKDGSGPISFIVEGTTEPGSTEEDAVQLACKYMQDIGIKATYKYFERSLYSEHYAANEIEAAWWGGDRTVLPLVPGAIIFRGTQEDRPWAAGFGLWYDAHDDPNAVEPPADHFIWKIWDIWDNQVSQESDPAKQNKLFEGILDIWAEELPMIGILGEQPAPVIVKNGFRNYLPGMPIDDTTGDEHFLQTETYFWDEPEKHTP